MSWLIPLGFLGLLGLAVLILIYVLKPNYQQRIVSSTYIWKLSLKYKKKRIPISKLRNILLFLCQVLVIVSCALILAQPVIKSDKPQDSLEKIVIIDSSECMRASAGGETRFERAVKQVKELAGDVTGKDGTISVVFATDTPYVLAERVKADGLKGLEASLDELSKDGASGCSYGSADIDAAIDLAWDIKSANANSEVLFYTGTEYLSSGSVTVVDVSHEDEWNAAILNANVEVDEHNFYSFKLDLACYGRSADLNLYCDVYGANEDENGETYDYTGMSMLVRFDNDDVKTVEFDFSLFYGNDFGGVFSYDYAHLYFREDDSIGEDNDIYLYGGKPRPVKIQYSSSSPNSFVPATLDSLRTLNRGKWDIEIDEVRRNGQPQESGYDFYIFEHRMPTKMPTDGVVLLINPTAAINGLNDVVFDGVEAGKFTLTAGAKHPVTDSTLVIPESILLRQYTKLNADGYDELLYSGGDPVLLVKNQPYEKVAIMPFSLNDSNLVVTMAFSSLMINMFNYYFPATITKEDGSRASVFEIGESVNLTARTDHLVVNRPDSNEPERYEAFPAKIKLTAPGSYTLTQPKMLGEEVVEDPNVIENIYVKVPAKESNILLVVDALECPAEEETEIINDKDLLVFFAAALVTLLFLEWLLHSREQL